MCGCACVGMAARGDARNSWGAAGPRRRARPRPRSRSGSQTCSQGWRRQVGGRVSEHESHWPTRSAMLRRALDLFWRAAPCPTSQPRRSAGGPPHTHWAQSASAARAASSYRASPVSAVSSTLRARAGVQGGVGGRPRAAQRTSSGVRMRNGVGRGRGRRLGSCGRRARCAGQAGSSNAGQGSGGGRDSAARTARSGERSGAVRNTGAVHITKQRPRSQQEAQVLGVERVLPHPAHALRPAAVHCAGGGGGGGRLLGECCARLGERAGPCLCRAAHAVCLAGGRAGGQYALLAGRRGGAHCCRRRVENRWGLGTRARRRPGAAPATGRKECGPAGAPVGRGKRGGRGGV
jgi:hypothetical protein